MSSASDFVIENGVLKKYVGPGGDVVIPVGVTVIGDWAFFKCTNLMGITIPEGVISIGRAFAGCENLTSVNIPRTVTTIGESAFSECKSLERIVIPEGVTNIGRYAFSYCRNLKDISIPDSVSEIGEGAFHVCPGLADEKGFQIFNLCCLLPQKKTTLKLKRSFWITWRKNSSIQMTCSIY